MPTFIVKSRTTSGITETSIDATDREKAIVTMRAAAAPGEELEVLNVTELPAAGATGATGASGPTGTQM